MQPGNQGSLSDQIISVTNSMETMPGDETRKKLVALINELINNDFNSLVQLLYRVDVFERKIRDSLNANGNSAEIIADLIIERQLQKVAHRKTFTTNSRQQNDEEKW